jgi:hypothetical protein
MIHYHKFLARCIKKLKRNGVDVKSSVSPVCVFLRDEVIAVSDHLASVSKFSSEEWMACLFYFHGWTDPNPDAEHELRKLVARQKVKAFGELQDLHSPLLRSQIDEQFLKAMSSSREQMNGGQAKQQGGGNKKDPHQVIMQHGYGMDHYNNASHPNVRIRRTIVTSRIIVFAYLLLTYYAFDYFTRITMLVKRPRDENSGYQRVELRLGMMVGFHRWDLRRP